MLTLSQILKILDWECFNGVYILYDTEVKNSAIWPNGKWVSGRELREKFDWKKEQVVRVKKAFHYDYDESEYVIVLKG